ncbi:MAG: hypothetical protein ABI947_14935 [Chloroflexota bacterium]
MKTFHKQLVYISLVLCFSLAITNFSNAAPAPTETQSGPRPTPTFSAGPTITPSGPYYSYLVDNVRSYFSHFPAKAGPFSLIPNLQDIDVPLRFALINTDGAQFDGIVYIGADAQGALYALAVYKSYMDHPQSVDLGDEAAVDAQGSIYLAVLRYRNLTIRISRSNISRDAKYPTPIPLTNDQLIAALTDLYTQMLVPSVPTITPIPPTQTALPPTQTYVAQFTATPTKPIVVTAQTAVASVQPN